MKRKRTPFSIYPRAIDKSKAAEIAEVEDLHISQIYMRAFRLYAKRWDKKRQQTRQLAHA